jgi:YD repeat-containing protein
MRSVLAGQDHKTVIEYNQRQQPLTVTETGYHPVDGSMQSRTTRYRHEEIAGRSLLSEIDGPLPNGPAGTPADSDITRYEWDAGGAYVRRIRHPMGATSEMEYDPHTGRLTLLTLRWERTVRQLRYAYDPLGQVEQVRERALDVDGVTVLAERELGLRWNALGRPSALVEADGTVRELEDGGLAGVQGLMASTTLATSTTSATSAPPLPSMTSAAMPSAVAARALAASLAGAAASPALTVPGMLPPADHTNVPVAAIGTLWPTQYGDPLTAAAHEALRFDANGRSAERRIDDFGQVVAIRNPGQGWQHARHDEAGRLVEIRDARAAITLARYDAAGRLLRVERTMPGELSEQVDITWRGPERLTEIVSIAGHQTHATHYRHAP